MSPLVLISRVMLELAEVPLGSTIALQVLSLLAFWRLVCLASTAMEGLWLVRLLLVSECLLLPRLRPALPFASATLRMMSRSVVVAASYERR